MRGRASRLLRARRGARGSPCVGDEGNAVRGVERESGIKAVGGRVCQSNGSSSSLRAALAVQASGSVRARVWRKTSEQLRQEARGRLDFAGQADLSSAERVVVTVERSYNITRSVYGERKEGEGEEARRSMVRRSRPLRRTSRSCRRCSSSRRQKDPAQPAQRQGAGRWTRNAIRWPR